MGYELGCISILDGTGESETSTHPGWYLSLVRHNDEFVHFTTKRQNNM